MRTIDQAMQDKVLAVARAGMTSAEAIGFFRVSLGLYYLAGLMTEEALDFKQIDAKYNRFIYHSLGGGHSIASVLQSERFRAAFTEYCPDIPVDSISFLISLNLGVAKSLSGLDAVGPVVDWIEQEKARTSQ